MVKSTNAKTKEASKRSIANRLAPHDGWVEPKLKKRKRLKTNLLKFDASPIKQPPKTSNSPQKTYLFTTPPFITPKGTSRPPKEQANDSGSKNTTNSPLKTVTTSPLKCRYCGRIFPKKESLKRHEEIIHRNKLNACRCRFCGKNFKYAQWRDNHLQKVHQNKLKNSNDHKLTQKAMNGTLKPVVLVDKVKSCCLGKKETKTTKEKPVKKTKQSGSNEKTTKAVKKVFKMKNTHSKTSSGKRALANRSASLDDVMSEILGDLGSKEQNANFVEKVRSKWFETPDHPSPAPDRVFKSSLSSASSTSSSSYNSNSPTSERNCDTSATINQDTSPVKTPTKLSHRALIHRIILSKNKQLGQKPVSILTDHSPDPNVQPPKDDSPSISL